MQIELCLFQAGLLTEKQLITAIEKSNIENRSVAEILLSRGDIKQQTVDYFIDRFDFISDERSLHNRQFYNNSRRKLSLGSVHLHPPTISKILFGIIVLLLVLSIGEKLAIIQLNQLTTTEFTTRFFSFDEEANFPTLYSFVTLAICSGLLAIISAIAKKSFQSAKFWRYLSFIFLFLAVDEACSIHEILIPLIKIVVDTRGFLYFPWVIPASILLIVFLFLFRHFIYNLPKKTRNLFLLAGGIYIGGALVMEIIGAYLADLSGLDTTAYWLAATMEELLEMFGILIFIHSLLLYIRSYLSELNISLTFTIPQKNIK